VQASYAALARDVPKPGHSDFKSYTGIDVEDTIVESHDSEYARTVLDPAIGKTEPVQLGAFTTKRGDTPQAYDSGMVRSPQEGKPRWDLILPADQPYADQLLTRIAELMARGAEVYGDRNWEQGYGDEELQRAKSSAFRHFMQWYCGERDEDHAAAVFFNVQQAEYNQWKRGS
jgi:hypothetical protein